MHVHDWRRSEKSRRSCCGGGIDLKLRSGGRLLHEEHEELTSILQEWTNHSYMLLANWKNASRLISW